MTIFLPPEIGAAEREVLTQIQELWRELAASIDRWPPGWTGLLARHARARATHGSSRVEGYVVSEEEALAALSDERPRDADEATWASVQDHRVAMDYVLQQANARYFRYSPDLLRALHFMMMRHAPSERPGLYRARATFVRDEASGDILYTGPDAEVVPTLVEELCAWLGKETGDQTLESRIIRAAMGHLNLVMIRPFRDGNGPMARALETLVLVRGAASAPALCSIEEYLGKNRHEYYRALAEVGGGSWQPDGDARPWIRFCLTAHLRQAIAARRREDAMAALFTEVRQDLQRKGLPSRAVVPVVNAAFGLSVRNEDYRREVAVSAQTAGRDLHALVVGDVLEAIGDKRARRYRPAPWLEAIAVEARRQEPVPDPFR